MNIRTLVVPIMGGISQAVVITALISMINAIGSWLGQFLATAYGPQGNSLIATAILWMFITSIIAVAIKSRRTPRLLRSSSVPAGHHEPVSRRPAQA